MDNYLKDYQGTGYGIINKFLREDDFMEEILQQHKPNCPIIKKIQQIDSILKTGNIKEDQILFRGFSNGVIQKALLYGNTLINRAYSSATTDKNIAKNFVSEGGCCIIMFTIDPNLKTYVYQYKGNYTEKEVLIERNTKFIIDLENSKPPVYRAQLIKYHPPKQTEQSIVYQKMLEKKRAEQDELSDFSSDTD